MDVERSKGDDVTGGRRRNTKIIKGDGPTLDKRSQQGFELGEAPVLVSAPCNSF